MPMFADDVAPISFTVIGPNQQLNALVECF